MIRFGRLAVFSVLLSVFLSSAWAQQLSLADLKTKLAGTWLVTVEGESRQRVLGIQEVTQQGDGKYSVTGTFNFTDQQTYALKDGELTVSAGDVTIAFKTGAGSLYSAVLKGEGVMAGTTKYQNGQVKNARFEKGAVAMAAAKPAQDRAFAEEDKDWGIEPSAKPQGPPHGKPTPTTIPGAKVIRTLALKSLLESNKQVVVVDVLNSSSGTRETIPGAHWMPGAGDGRFFAAEKSRFAAAMEKVTGGDKNRPLVFMCISSQCWEGYNGALHAMEAGYKDVTWYRGGTNSWKAARQEMKTPEKFNW
jgi:PQQ-dependent catabolism-associated CXXCW motif protein